jgi:hypothetical protein
MNTLETYKKSIKAKYELEKQGVFSDYLINPSPAKIKNLCVFIFEKNLNQTDLGIFDRFFNFKEKENKIKQIAAFDTDKFRPFKNFLIQNTDISQMESLNLIAVLVDFHPRPYFKFRSKDYDEDVVIESDNDIEKEIDERIVSQIIAPVKRFSWKQKVGVMSLVLLFLLSLGYCVKHIFFPNKDGMIWVRDHYEAVEYEAVKNKAEVKPMNLVELDNFKKITNSDTVTFFKDGLPIVWYAKHNGRVELFNSFGFHPETRKPLKPITHYIIKKYHLKYNQFVSK